MAQLKLLLNMTQCIVVSHQYNPLQLSLGPWSKKPDRNIRKQNCSNMHSKAALLIGGTLVFWYLVDRCFSLSAFNSFMSDKGELKRENE